MAAGEDQPQALVADVHVVLLAVADAGRRPPSAPPSSASASASRASSAALPAKRACRRKRSIALCRAVCTIHARGLRGGPSRPLGDGERERLLRRLLGHVEVTDEPNQRRHDASPLLAVELRNESIDRLPHHLESNFIDRTHLDRSEARADGIFAASAIASSRSLASTR